MIAAAQLINRAVLNSGLARKHTPQLIYTGCALAVYSFIAMPLAVELEVTLPPFPLAGNDLFWTAWGAALLPGVAQRSMAKTQLNDNLAKLKSNLGIG